MRVDLTMPQMGESIAEGTISRWRKKVGERVERDEPIVEISTDKVDAEIPAPAGGVVIEIRGQEGETVPVNQVIAVIDTESAGKAAAPAPAEAAPAAPAQPAPEAAAPAPPVAPEAPPAAEEKKFYTPVVRKLAEEHGIDPASVTGTGVGGRVTKNDVLAYVAAGAGAQAQPAPAPTPAPSPSPAPALGTRGTRERMSVMRKRIAERMVESRRTSAHVHTVFEVDMTRITRLRDAQKQAFLERHGIKLTVTAYLVRALCSALQRFPILNASVEGDEIVYHKDMNVGVAVALDWGLIVPVVRGADQLSLPGIALRVDDLASRARAKKLAPEDVQGGTFTLTNPGQYGGLYGLPIIQQPQVAILGVGGIEKRPVVIDDAIAIRPMMYLALSYDHRVIDGAVAGQFLAALKQVLEAFDEDAV
jgi:2-oxoglutarate dehydrogenase E2 component (dihydrolipoamide succinyltransferase)